MEELVKQLESLKPLDQRFEDFVKGSFKPLGQGLYKCLLYTDDRRAGYALYDNGTSVYNDTPKYLGYHLFTEIDTHKNHICPHCGHEMYDFDPMYLDENPNSGSRHYSALEQEHLKSCWDNPANKNLIPIWKKKIAERRLYGLYNWLTNWEVSKFTVVDEQVGACSIDGSEI